MWNRRWILAVGLAICGCTALQFAGRSTAQQVVSSSKSDSDSLWPKESKKELDADLACAKAYLRLMEAVQNKYQEINRLQPNSIPPSVMQVFQQGVGEATDYVQSLEKGGMSDGRIYAAFAESELRSRRDSLRQAEQANAVSPGAVSASQVAVLQADVDLAKVRLERARDLADEPPLSSVRFELGQLHEEVQRLRMFVAVLRERQ
jgi:hypothetical protein